MAYTADINIVVRGARELNQLQNKLRQTAADIQRLDNIWKGAQSGPQTLDRFNKALQTASSQLRVVRQGTEAETVAIQNYVKALNLANAARERQNRLIAQEVANQRRVIPTANAGFGVQGPALARQSATGGRRGQRLDVGGIASNAIIGGAFPLLFGQGGGAATGGAIGGAVGGLFGGAGGFAGSLLGTLIGDIASQGAKIKQLGEDIGFSAEQTKILEGAFSRAGREAEKFEAAVQNIRGLGLSLEDQADAINLAARLTEQYGGKIDKVAAAYADFVEKGKVGIADINKFTAQGVPILEELEKKYNTNRTGVLALAKDGKITAQELSDALVKIAQTSDAVNKKVKTGWDKVWDDLSKGASMSVRGIVAVFSALTGQTTSISGDIASIFSGLYRRLIEGAINAGASISRVLAATARGLANYAATIELGGLNIGATAAKGTLKGAEKIFTNIDKQLQEVRRTSATPVGAIEIPGQAPDTGRKKRPKQAPENRTAQLMDELRATIDIGKAEDRIRDLRFQGRDILAAQAEFDKQAADILRDKNKALREANYESERIVINKIAEARTAKAAFELEDQIREIQKQRADAYEAVLRGPKEEIRLIDARMLGKEREVEIEMRIEELKREQTYLNNQQIEQYRQQLELLYQRQDAEKVFNLQQQIRFRGAGLQAGFIGQAGGVFEQKLAEGASVSKATELAQLTQQLELVDAQARAVEGAILSIGDAFGTAMTVGVAELVNGTKTAQQVFADFLKAVSNALLEAAAQMIATYIAIGIAKAFAGLSGGNSGASSLNFADMAKYSAPLPGFAQGGLVTRPTMAMVGEGGEPEYIIPASKMDTAMARYNAGARGAGVIPNGPGSGPAAPDGAGVTVAYTGPTLNFNGDEYLPKSAVPDLINAAARQGAEMGQGKTLRTLQNSRSTRSRIGI